MNLSLGLNLSLNLNLKLNMTILLMGVSGSGKTTIGKILSDRLSLPFFDADDFHPPENLEKMKSGLPLTDADRKPWLVLLSGHLQQLEKQGGSILACSALKKSYRDLLFAELNPASSALIYLKGTYSKISERLQHRRNHYMPADLLNSQFEDLEEPEDAITVSICNSPEMIAELLVKSLASIRRKE